MGTLSRGLLAIVLLAGLATAAQAVEDELASRMPTSRISGADRYDTAAQVASRNEVGF